MHSKCALWSATLSDKCWEAAKDQLKRSYFHHPYHCVVFVIFSVGSTCACGKCNKELYTTQQSTSSLPQESPTCPECTCLNCLTGPFLLKWQPTGDWRSDNPSVFDWSIKLIAKPNQHVEQNTGAVWQWLQLNHKWIRLKSDKIWLRINKKTLVHLGKEAERTSYKISHDFKTE